MAFFFHAKKLIATKLATEKSLKYFPNPVSQHTVIMIHLSLLMNTHWFIITLLQLLQSRGLFIVNIHLKLNVNDSSEFAEEFSYISGVVTLRISETA